MKITVNESMFVDRFDEMNCSENFSRAGRRTLYSWLMDLESDSGIEMELDVIALCCDFTESTIVEALQETGLDSIDDLKDSTLVLEVDDSTIIYQAFSDR